MADNILHSYANYTYILELWACSKDTFNSNSTEGDELLMADGGLGGKGNIFDVNFSLDNVEIETIIGGIGRRGFAANALSLKFDIIEPYTVTLLERLAKVADLYAEQDFKSIIYMLKIKFVGYNEGGYGGPVTIDTTDKRFFFTMISINFNITHRGAVYHCEGIATKNMSMLSMMDNVIPANTELQGKTIDELFGSGESSSDNEAKNLKNALAKFEDQAVKETLQEQKNEITFEFDSDFGGSKIIDPANIQTPNATLPGSNIKQKDAATTLEQGKKGTLELNDKQGIVKAQAGTRIVDFIGAVLSGTEYMKNQVGKNNDTFIGWKVRPEITLKEYDHITNYYSRKINFKVEKYNYSGLDHPDFGQKPPDNIVKTYDYIFTGKNKDVVKVNLDFHMAFFEVTTLKSKQVDKDTNATPGPPRKQDYTEENTPTKNVQIKPYKSPFSNIGQRINTTSSTNDPEVMAVGEMISKLLDNGVDIMSLDLEIVGDPDWILQDEESDTIDYLNRDVNFKFNFITPTSDYQNDGLFDLSPHDVSFFSGIYKVISVKNIFRKGRFSQTLSNTRVRIQPE